MKMSTPLKLNSSILSKPRRLRPGYILLLTLLLGVLLSTLAASIYQSSLQGKAQGSALLRRLQLYQELQAVALWGVQQLRDLEWSEVTGTKRTLASPPLASWSLRTEKVSEEIVTLELTYQPNPHTELSFEMLLWPHWQDVSERAYHQRDLPSSPPEMLWQSPLEQERVEASLQHEVWLSDPWVRPTFDVQYVGDQLLEWDGQQARIAGDNHSLSAPLSLLVSGNLLLRLPAEAELGGVLPQLLLWVEGTLILQAAGESPVGFRGIAIVEGPQCLEQTVSEVFWQGHLSCVQVPQELGLFHLRQAPWPGGQLLRPQLKLGGVRPLTE